MAAILADDPRTEIVTTLASGISTAHGATKVVPYRKLFLSRWSALIWACGIMWTAIDVAGVSPSVVPDNVAAITDNTSIGDPALDNNIALFNQVLSGG